MALLKPEDLQPLDDLPREVVTIEALHGDAVLQGFGLQQYMRFLSLRRDLSAQREGESPTDAAERAGAEILPHALHWGVLGEGDVPLMSADAWRRFADVHRVEALQLFRRLMVLSGNDVEVERKNF